MVASMEVILRTRPAARALGCRTNLAAKSRLPRDAIPRSGSLLKRYLRLADVLGVAFGFRFDEHTELLGGAADRIERGSVEEFDDARRLERLTHCRVQPVEHRRRRSRG